MTIAVVGSGRVGLVVGACLAGAGHRVACADVDGARVEGLARGAVGFVEPRLGPLVRAGIESGRLSFTTEAAAAVRGAAVVFLAVPTPTGPGGESDLTNLLAAARGIADALEPGTVVALKSTAPVGTAARVQAEIRRRTRLPVELASNPEFLREGTAVDDFLRPDRIVIGADSARAREALTELHRSFTPAATPILAMDVASAEIAKQAANSMLAARVSLMNAVAALCDAAGADVEQVRRAVGADRRIGTAFLAPGVGYGGSCLPKDVQAFAHALAERGMDDALPRAITRVNERQRGLPLRRIVARLGADLTGRVVAVWGLAFKPGTDDLREAPSLVTVRGLLDRGACVAAHDPAAMDAARRRLGDHDRLRFAPDPYAALDGADALAIHTEWAAYREPDFGRMRAALAIPFVVDGRNLYDPAAMRVEGFDYLPIGRAVPERR